MGLYDTYGHVQLKVGEVERRHFEVGAQVSIPDGVYVGYEGVVVVTGGRFVASFPHLINKWGERLNIDLSGESPIWRAIEHHVDIEET